MGEHAMGVVRRPAVAGLFYPAEAGDLERSVAAYLAAAAAAGPQPTDEPKAVPKAIIAPHAGYIYSGPVAASVYARLAPARGRITRVVLFGPSHRVPFRGLAVTSATAYATPLGDLAIDRAAVETLLRLPGVTVLDQAHGPEHSLEVHLPFLQAVLGGFSLVPVVAGQATPEQVAAALDAVWGGPETLVVISTDLSHYLDYDAARRLDATTAAAIERLDIEALGADQACGRVPVGGLLSVARRRGLRVETIDVRNSGDTAGARDQVVGYGAWAFVEPPAEDFETVVRRHGAALFDLARRAIAYGLERGHEPTVSPDPSVPELLRRPAATFVTLRKRGELRGCIGSVIAHRPLFEDVAGSAYRAAFEDPRFPKLDRAEMDQLEMSISVLSPPRPMTFADEADLLRQLRPRLDGVILADQGRRGLFLPAVWESLPQPVEFLRHLKMKAGLPPDWWSPTVAAERFTAIELKPPGDMG